MPTACRLHCSVLLLCFLIFILLLFVSQVQADPIVIATIPVGIAPDGVSVNPNTNLVYVANQSSDTVSVIDGTTNRVTVTINVGDGPREVAMNLVTHRIYVPNYWSNTVSVIDETTNTVIGAPIVVGNGPVGAAANPITNRIYVANSNSNTVSVIDGAAGIVVATINTAAGPRDVAVNPVTNHVYVANWTNSVSVIDGTTNTVVATVNLGSNLAGIAVNPASNYIYVSDWNNNTVRIINGATNTVLGTPIPVGGNPLDIEIDPTTQRIFVVNFGSYTLSTIDGMTNAVIGAPIPVGTAPAGVGVNPTSNRIYVASHLDGIVSVVGEPQTPSTSGPVQAGADTDSDSIYDDRDNCGTTYNPDQTDADQDGAGNACDAAPGICPGEVLSVLNAPASVLPNGGGVHCRMTPDRFAYLVPNPPAGYRHALSPNYTGYFDVFGIDRAGQSFDVIAPIEVCFRAAPGGGNQAIGLYRSIPPTFQAAWEVLPSVARGDQVCATLHHLGSVALLVGP